MSSSEEKKGEKAKDNDQEVKLEPRGADEGPIAQILSFRFFAVQRVRSAGRCSLANANSRAMIVDRVVMPTLPAPHLLPPKWLLVFLTGSISMGAFVMLLTKLLMALLVLSSSIKRRNWVSMAC